MPATREAHALNTLPASRDETDDSARRTESWLDANATVVSLVLVAVNLVLKLPRISAQGLWFDEAVSLSQVQGSFDLLENLSTDASAPLYGILLYGWSSVFGPSLEAARGLSVGFSSFTAALLFLFGRRFLDGRTGLFAALLFTASRTQLYYGHEARAYALVGLLCVASFYAFLLVLEEPTRRRTFTAAALSAALVYAHYIAVFALVAQLLTALCTVHVRSRAMSAYVVSQVLAAGLFAPCAAYLLMSSTPLPMATWIRPPVPGDILYVLNAFSGGPLLVGLYTAVLTAAVALGRSGLATFDRDRVVLLALWLVAPLALDYAFSFAVPSFLYRYLLYASLALFLLAAYALTRLPLPEPARFGVLLVLLLPAAWGMLSDPILRADWRGAAEVALREHGEGVLTVVTPPYQLLPFAYHYSRDSFATPAQMVDNMNRLGVYGVPHLVGLAETAQNESHRIVVVSAANDTPTELDDLMARAHYERVRSREFTDVRVNVFESSR